MDRQPVLMGERLVLRPLRRDDWPALFGVAADPLIWEQHPVHDRWREDVFCSFFDDAIGAGGALIAIRLSDGAVIGSSQFRACPIVPHELEIGWTFLARDCWGTGLNPEMKRLMLDHAMLTEQRVLFRIGEHNVRSRMAIEAIGARLVDGLIENGEYRGEPIRHVVYEITCESVLDGQSRRSA